MADTKISDLSSASALAGAEPVALVQGGATVKGTFAGVIKTYFATIFATCNAGLTAGRVAITTAAGTIADTSSLLWDNTLKKLSVVSAGTSGLAALVVTGNSGTSKTQINDNGTVVIDADVTTGVTPLAVKYNTANRFTVAATGDATATGKMVGASVEVASGSLTMDSVATVRGRLRSYNELELCPGSLGGSGTFVEVNNGTVGTYRDVLARSYRRDATITAGGTTGAQTINKTLGTVNFAAAATTLVVTNSLVTTSSVVMAVVRTNDTTAIIKNVVPAAGSFTITLNAAATAETSVGFVVHNA